MFIGNISMGEGCFRFFEMYIINCNLLDFCSIILFIVNQISNIMYFYCVGTLKVIVLSNAQNCLSATSLACQ